MSSIRKLEKHDLAQIEKLWSSSHSLLKEEYSRSQESAELYFDNKDFQLYGSFLDGELIATIGIRLWSNLPYFTLIDMVYKKNVLNAVQAAYNMNEILVLALDNMHRAGRFTFYLLTLTRFRQVKAAKEGRQILHSKYFKILDQYDCYVEEIFKPGETSPFVTWNSLMGHRPHQREVWIRRYSLKPLLRDQYDGLQDC